MKKLIALLTFALGFNIANGQKPEIDAEYYNAKGILYKIERKFTSAADTSHLYLRISNDEVVFVKRSIKEYNDTVVMIESYGRFVPMDRNEKYTPALNFDLEYITSGDTTFLIYLFENDSISIDTLFLGRCKMTGHTKRTIPKPVISFLDQAHQKKSAFLLDSLLVQESVVTYFVNKQPVKVESLNSNGSFHSREFIKKTDNEVTIQKYFMNMNHSVDLYEFDTMRVSEDNAVILWKTHRVDWQQSFETTYSIKGLSCSMSENDTVFWQFAVYQQIDFKDLLLANHTYYNDALYEIELLHFERRKFVSTKSLKSGDTFYKYEVTRNGKIRTASVFKTDGLVKTVRYSYNNRERR